MHELTEQLQADRKAELFFKESHDELEAKLRNEIRPDNMIPSLPRSPCVRVKATGEVLPWHQTFADHPELCECCNEDGSPFDPAQAVQPVERSKFQASDSLNTVLPRVDGVGDDRTPPVGIADKLLGTTFAEDFTTETRRDAMPLPEQEEPVAVDDLVKAVFEKNV